MKARGFAGRRARAVLVLLALLMQALLPSGYMLAAAQDGPPAIVICTGHGPLKLAAPSDRKAPLQKKSAGVCAFAGQGAPPIPQAAQPLSEIRWSEAVPVVDGVRRSLFVGRHLAAPPPSRGPPTVLV